MGNCDIEFARLPSIYAITLLLTFSVLPVRAITLDAYVELTAELTIAYWGCKLEADPVAYSEISPSFAKRDPEKREELEKRIDDAILSVDKRRGQMGNPAFCGEMIAKYGPEGTKQKGLFK